MVKGWVTTRGWPKIPRSGEDRKANATPGGRSLGGGPRRRRALRSGGVEERVSAACCRWRPHRVGPCCSCSRNNECCGARVAASWVDSDGCRSATALHVMPISSPCGPRRVPQLVSPSGGDGGELPDVTLSKRRLKGFSLWLDRRSLACR